MVVAGPQWTSFKQKNHVSSLRFVQTKILILFKETFRFRITKFGYDNILVPVYEEWTDD